MEKFPRPVRIKKIGIKVVGGFFKCGSQFHPDWAKDIVGYAFRGGEWFRCFEGRDIPCPPWSGNVHAPPEGETVWLPLGVPAEVSALALEIRSCGTDGYFPGYNVANWGVEAETEECGPRCGAPAGALQMPVCRSEVGEAQAGVWFEDLGPTVCYSTPYYRVELYKYLPRIKQLAVDPSGRGNRQCILRDESLYKAAGEDLASGFLLEPLEGNGVCLADTEISPEAAVYRLRGGRGDFSLRFSWNRRGFSLTCEHLLESETYCAEFADLRLCFDTAAAAPCVLGVPVRAGRAGAVALPAVLVLPGIGNITVRGKGGAVLFDNMRLKGCSCADFRAGTQPGEHGDTVLPAGKSSAEFSFRFGEECPVRLQENAPAEVREAVQRFAYCCLPYRADTDLLSNNGNSIHAFLCMDNFAFMQRAVPRLHTRTATKPLLLHTLQAWLNGVPSYASGNLAGAGHALEEEYLLDIPACLAGLAAAVRGGDEDRWLQKNLGKVGEWLERAFALDSNGDGLLESRFRRGIGGEHQWSTNWYDVISFGWQDAFVNAVCYDAYRTLAPSLRRVGKESWAEELERRAAALKSAYVPTFFVQRTGRFAGWKSADGKLHDRAFLFVNGAAVNAGLVGNAEGGRIISGLYGQWKNSPFSRCAEYGLPANLEPIPSEEMALPEFDFGSYQNGSVTLSQSRHFVGAMLRVGMVREADELLCRMARGLLSGNAVGGVGSGVDWHTPNGEPCGYEGILSDEFGILALMVARWNRGDTAAKKPDIDK